MDLQQLECGIDAYVDEVWDDVLDDIASLVSHNSVARAEDGVAGAPFGPGVRGALDCALGIARKLGYETSEDEGFMGMADIPGERAEQLATIAHVDVVPAGPGWATDPFRMERREGWLVGRGVIDDKGPAVLSLYAGAYLLRCGVTPRYTFRALLGCDEEVGMSDVHHYLDRHPQPAFLFTPDAEFPVCNAEKGQLGGRFVSASIEDGRIVSWSGAEATNAIPGQSELILSLDASEFGLPQANADRLSAEPEGAGRTRIFAKGIGGHASLPEGSLNAIGLVAAYLRELLADKPDALAPAEHDFVKLLGYLTADAYGKVAGIASESAAFGPLTMNAGTVRVREDGRLEQTIDVRFPDSTDVQTIRSALEALACAHGCTFELTSAKDPFSTSAESPAVQVLVNTYNEVTSKSAEPFAMGGGTYARNFERAVSFGPEEDGLELPVWGGPMHGPNEVANEALLRQALKIYILAILRLQDVEL